MTKYFILYAPNVHTGGGFVLLQSLINSWDCSIKLKAILDFRAKVNLEIPSDVDVIWIKPNLYSRIKAEFNLYELATSDCRTLCFHGLPPLLPIKSEVFLFQQNRNYFGLNRLKDFPFKVALRLGIERIICKAFKKRVSKYIVQTPSMKNALLTWYADNTSQLVVDVFPFFNTMKFNTKINDYKWDFIYVADGVAHKNHLRLLDAWVMLAKEGLFPSLAVTLTSRDELLIERFKTITAKFSLKIVNLGQLNRDEIGELYSTTEALIFPSTSESFGLPLIEASQANVKIVASELDFVRDVCSPVETFDPSSVISIYRSVKRYLRAENKPLKIHSAKEFIDEYVIK